ncbi:uncharacterized protein [Temnothorax nylanderi]|uniref:uncharacterized protein isoform X2 n=1 Tax=Temnothorax nylanderi TaxID=102681 RepID=UPI003A897276
MDSQIKFASVRYFDDESKKIHIVPIERIKNFVVLNKYEDPYFVKRLNTVTMEESLVAAQIMEVGTNEEDLKHNKRRYVFKKLGYSDAVQIILDKENPEPNKTQKETEFNNERTSEEDDENIINEKLKTTNRDAKIFKRNQNKFSKIPSAVDRTSKMDDVDIIKNKLETLNRDNIAFEKTCEKLFEIPIAVEQEIQYLKDENNKLQLENNNLKTDIFLLKEELHTLKTKKQFFPKDLKRAASPPITSTPKKMRSKTTVNAPLQDTICSEPGTSQLIHEQSPLQEDDLCMQVSTENKTHKANNPKAKGKKKKQKKKAKKTKKPTKDQEKGKNKRSDLDYDSDQFVKLTDKENMTAWDDEVNGTTIKMMHLRYGISIPYTIWKEIKKLRRPSLFVRQLSRALWGVHKLMNRAVVLEKCKNRLPNRSPRKSLTPVKKAVLRKEGENQRKLQCASPNSSASSQSRSSQSSDSNSNESSNESSDSD